MTELAVGYTTERFPYAQILIEQTQDIIDREIPPVEAYLDFLVRRDQAELGPYFDYGSTAITSAGHARLAETQGLSMPQIISANTATARQIAGVMDGQGTLEGSELVLPVDLGNTGWKQSEFMLYWGLIIGGPDFRELAARSGNGLTVFERRFNTALEQHEADTPMMNNSKVSNMERWSHYAGFVAALADVIKVTDVAQQPAHRVISFVDGGVSLGGAAETKLADHLGIHRQRIKAVGPGTMEAAISLRPLREDLKVLRAFGAPVVIASQGSVLMLERDTQPSDYASM